MFFTAESDELFYPGGNKFCFNPSLWSRVWFPLLNNASTGLGSAGGGNQGEQCMNWGNNNYSWDSPRRVSATHNLTQPQYRAVPSLARGGRYNHLSVLLLLISRPQPRGKVANSWKIEMGSSSTSPLTPTPLPKSVVFATSGLGGCIGWVFVHPANTTAGAYCTAMRLWQGSISHQNLFATSFCFSSFIIGSSHEPCSYAREESFLYEHDSTKRCSEFVRWSPDRNLASSVLCYFKTWTFWDVSWQNARN